jgi:hypothetical protein
MKPKCPHCGSTEEPYFSRIEPMGYVCVKCGQIDDAPDKRATMNEQCWLGIGLMLFWGFVICAIFYGCTPARAATVKLAWNPNPETDIANYELRAWEVLGTQDVRVKTTNTTADITGLKVGVPYFFSVRAINTAGAMSDWHTAILYTPPERLRLTIQRSGNMATWTDTATTMEVTREATEFFRLKIEPINQ